MNPLTVCICAFALALASVPPQEDRREVNRDVSSRQSTFRNLGWREVSILGVPFRLALDDSERWGRVFLLVDEKYFTRASLCKIFGNFPGGLARRGYLRIDAFSDEGVLLEELERWPRERASFIFHFPHNERGREGMKRYLGVPGQERRGLRASYVRQRDGEEYFGYTPDAARDRHIWVRLDRGLATDYVSKNLSEAIQQGDLTMIETLLSQGARSSIPASTLLLIQPKLNKKNTVRLLLRQGESIEGRGMLHETPLIAAASSGDAELVRILLDNGADINADDGFAGKTALIFAAEYQYPAVVETLVNRGADVNVAGRDAYTALIYAAENEDARSAKALLAGGASPNARDKDGRTALFHSRDWVATTLIDVLVDAGAEVDSRDRSDWTSLMLAARLGKTTLVQALLRRGANALLKNSEGQNATDLARVSSAVDSKMLELLKSAAPER